MTRRSRKEPAYVRTHDSLHGEAAAMRVLDEHHHPDDPNGKVCAIDHTAERYVAPADEEEETRDLAKSFTPSTGSALEADRWRKQLEALGYWAEMQVTRQAHTEKVSFKLWYVVTNASHEELAMLLHETTPTRQRRKPVSQPVNNSVEKPVENEEGGDAKK